MIFYSNLHLECECFLMKYGPGREMTNCSSGTDLSVYVYGTCQDNPFYMGSYAVLYKKSYNSQSYQIDFFQLIFHYFSCIPRPRRHTVRIPCLDKFWCMKLFSWRSSLLTGYPTNYVHVSCFCYVVMWLVSLSWVTPLDLSYPWQWRHKEHNGLSNHQPRGCLFNRLFRRKSKKIWKLRVTGFCVGNSPVTGEFPA